MDQKLGKWGEIGASFYYTQYHHLFDGLQFINNATVYGTEIELVMHPLKRLRFGGNYTFMHTQNDDDGTRLADRPNQQWNVFVEGRPLDKLLLRLDVDIVGNRLIPNTISTASGDIPFIFLDLNGVPEGGSFAAAATPQGRTLGAYTTTHIAATYNIAKDRWHLKNWKVYGKVMNLFNSHYQQKFGFFEPGITFLMGTQATF